MQINHMRYDTNASIGRLLSRLALLRLLHDQDWEGVSVLFSLIRSWTS